MEDLKNIYEAYGKHKVNKSIVAERNEIEKTLIQSYERWLKKGNNPRFLLSMIEEYTRLKVAGTFFVFSADENFKPNGKSFKKFSKLINDNRLKKSDKPLPVHVLSSDYEGNSILLIENNDEKTPWLLHIINEESFPVKIQGNFAIFEE